MVYKRIIFTICFLILIFPALSKNSYSAEGASGKKILIVVGSTKYNDTEFEKPKSVFTQKGYTVVIASTTDGTAKSDTGSSTNVDPLLQDADMSEYEAIVFIGGWGAEEFLNNDSAHQKIKEANKQGKVVAGICYGACILANAGVLNGKKATTWSAKSNLLTKGGAKYTGGSVESDGNIVTANGPNAAHFFGVRITEILSKK